MLWGTAICFLAQIVPLGTLIVSALPSAAADEPLANAASPSRWRAMLPLLAFTGLFVEGSLTGLMVFADD
jgi:SET family sugar efflux transporter-like MFS transporter